MRASIILAAITASAVSASTFIGFPDTFSCPGKDGKTVTSTGPALEAVASSVAEGSATGTYLADLGDAVAFYFDYDQESDSFTWDFGEGYPTSPGQYSSIC